MGMKEDEMKQIALFMRRLAIDGESAEKVVKEVVEFKKQFMRVQYCL